MCDRVNMNVYVNKFFKYYYLNINEQILSVWDRIFYYFVNYFLQ